jgi:exodeoxyribonuclease VII small subunit
VKNDTNTVGDDKQDQHSLAGFEASLNELETVVKELEGNEVPLERALALFERGMALTQNCRKMLEEAETRVEVLLKKDGKMQAEEFRPQ